MSDSTSPRTVSSVPELPGIRDYQVVVPVHRTTYDGETEAGQIRFRIPAADAGTATRHAQSIAEHLGAANGGGTDDPWTVNLTGVQVTETDAPSVDELLEQINHWQRIITVLATKFPYLASVSPAEYAAAHPSELAMRSVGGAMLFAVPAAYQRMITNLPAGGSTSDGAPVVVGEPLPQQPEPELLPAARRVLAWQVRQVLATASTPQQFHLDGDWFDLITAAPTELGSDVISLVITDRDGDEREIPLTANTWMKIRDRHPGGVNDPDARRIRARNLNTVATRTPLHILVQGWWMTVDQVDVDDTAGTVTATCTFRHPVQGRAVTQAVILNKPDAMVTVRPAAENATTTVFLQRPHGRQVLVSRQWWTIDRFRETVSGGYEVDLENLGRAHTHVFGRDDTIIMRDAPFGWS